MRGPIVLFAAWALHDAEETLTFPASADCVADLTGIDALRMTTKQSVAAIGLVGAALAAAGIRGVRTRGDSRFYRSSVAGLEAHVFTHLLSAAVARRYTSGVLTAVPIMWPGAAYARRELAALGKPTGVMGHRPWARWRWLLTSSSASTGCPCSEVEGIVSGGRRAAQPLQMQMPDQADVGRH